MEPVDLLLSSQKPSAGSFRERNESIVHPPTVFKVHFNIVVPSTPGSYVLYTF